jgi:hypothetical protein
MIVLYDQTLAHLLADCFCLPDIILLANQILQCPFGPEGIEFCTWKEVTYLGE